MRTTQKSLTNSFPNSATLPQTVTLVVVILLGLVCRCWNCNCVFADGAAFFLDGDCYARMSRAARVLDHPGILIRHHEFENWPDGVNPHTTAPLDYFIVALAVIARVLPSNWRFEVEALDFAGAIVGPVLFGVGTVGLFYAWPKRQPGRWISLVALSVIPPVAWAGLLGRPDHQALLLPLLTIAFVLSTRWLEGLGQEKSRPNSRQKQRLGITVGFLWGLAIWVSLFEPVIMLLAGLGASLTGRLALRLAGRPLPALAQSLRAACFPLLGAAPPLLMLLVIERPTITLPGIGEAFGRWAKLIPELGEGSFEAALSWMGWGMLFVFMGLTAGGIRAVKKGTEGLGEAITGLLLLTILMALFFWQRRWAPYAASGMALMAPFAGRNLIPLVASMNPAIIRRSVAIWAVISVVWYPASEWDRLVFSSSSVDRRGDDLADGISLRRMALSIRAAEEIEGARDAQQRGIMAPYWLCPPLAYWSGQPAVGGTSHQSLPGILDTAEFFAASDWLEAARLLDRRRIRWVVADVAERTVGSAVVLLGKSPGRHPIGLRLERFGTLQEPGPEWLVEHRRFGWFRLFEVVP